ncbi:hypothetical protein INR49_023002 [Caranx melampygus]|nr:hypothetical protein INR49_023002 [Caranx melampygus]
MDPMKAQQLAAELEVEMMADMYNRMTNACHRKCVPPHYKEAELTKGESVCLDRCVAKYLDLHEKLGQDEYGDRTGGHTGALGEAAACFDAESDPAASLDQSVLFSTQMEATDGEEQIRDGDHLVAPPNGGINELLNVGQEDNMQGEMEEFLGPQAEYNEEEEERKYYRRKRLGVIKNVLAASVGAMIVYSVYMGLLQMQLILHYDMTYREVKYSNLGLEDIDHKMLMGINVTPIIGLLYTPVLIRFLGTKWMMFLASGIYALFVSTNYWERYYTLVPSAIAIGVAIVPLWASIGNYITRMAQQYYEYVNYKEEHVQEQKKLPKGACHSYIIVFHSVFNIIFHLSFVFAEFPMRLVLHSYLHDDKHILWNVKACEQPVSYSLTHQLKCQSHPPPLQLSFLFTPGARVSGLIPGFNTTVLTNLPRSMLLIQVESVLMGFAFLSMIIFLVLCGAAYRPTEEIDLRSIGWGNIFQLPFKHLRDYRLRLLCPFFIYSGFEVLFAITGFSLEWEMQVNKIGLTENLEGCSSKKNVYFSSPFTDLWCLHFGSEKAVAPDSRLWPFLLHLFLLSLCILRLPRWTCLVSGAIVHFVLLVALLAFSLQRKENQTYPEYLVPLLVIAVLWGLGTALNKTGVSTLLGMLYAEEKERLDFVYTIYHWWQAIAIFIVYLWYNLPMRAKLSILLATLLLACYCYWVKGYRYLEEENSDESDSERSEEDEEKEEDDEHVVEEMEAENREEGGQDRGVHGADSPRARRRGAEGQRRKHEVAHMKDGETDERE